RLLVVVEPDRARQVLDCFAENALLQANVADVDARQGVLWLTHEHLLKGEQGVVELILQHQRPAEKRLGLRIVWRQVEGVFQDLLRATEIAHRNLAPSLLYEGRGADVVGADHRLLAAKSRRNGWRYAPHALPFLDESKHVPAECRERGQIVIDGLEQR